MKIRVSETIMTSEVTKETRTTAAASAKTTPSPTTGEAAASTTTTPTSAASTTTPSTTTPSTTTGESAAFPFHVIFKTKFSKVRRAFFHPKKCELLSTALNDATLKMMFKFAESH